MKHQISKSQLTLYLFILISGLIVGVKNFKYEDKSEDIFYIFTEGERIHDGTNPYSRVKEGDMRANDKYATYFPLFYLQASLMYSLGLNDYSDWLIAWRIIAMLVFAALSWLIFSYVYNKVNYLAAIFSVCLWQFHAYTLYVTRIAQIDFIPILFLMLALILADRKLKMSLILFGVSLAFKQMAIFVAPIFFIIAKEKKGNWKKALGQCFLYAGIVPFVTSLPFMIWDPVGFFQSIMFSATRGYSSSLGTESIDAFFCMEGIVTVLPMLAIMIMIYFMFYKKTISGFMSSFLLLSVFVGFNTVLFKQYLIWPLLHLPFIIVDNFQLKTTNNEQESLPC